MMLYCENCGRDTPHVEVDMGIGWTEYGSHGQNHIDIVAECCECGAIAEDYDGGDMPI
jgi:uncharacterized Zn finger protein